MATTNYREIQNDEIEALQAIYQDGFKQEKSRIGAWNNVTDPTFSITLRRTHQQEDIPSFTLQVTLPNTYPNSIPRLSLEFGNHVSKAVRTAADTITQELPQRLLGSEMIYDLTTALQDTLDNDIQADMTNVPTLEEERVANEKALKDKTLAKEAKRLKELEYAEAEHERQEAHLLEQLVEQGRARMDRRRVSSHTAVDRGVEKSVAIQDIPNGFCFERPSVKLRDPEGRMVTIRAVQGKIFLKKGPATSLYLTSPYSEDPSPSCKPYLCLKTMLIEDKADASKHFIQTLQVTLDSQMQMLPHPAVTRPLNFRLQRARLDSSQSKSWSLDILLPFAPRGSLDDLLSIVGTTDLKRTKTWCIQLLEGLHDIHRQGSAHGQIHLSNILLWDGEGSTISVMWSDSVFGLLLNQFKASRKSPLSADWTPPEVLASEENLTNAKADIWYFGVCLVKMVFGQEVVLEYQSPDDLTREAELTPSFKAVLSSIFALHANKRASAWDLLHFEFFLNEDSIELTVGLEVPRVPRRRRESEAPIEASEYSRKFVEEGRIGKGGFGEVFRVRNRTDGQLYAIKKICARSRSALAHVLSEATVLSRLNHPNVVRYFASWIEESADDATESINADEISEVISNASTATDSLCFRPSMPSSRGLDFISSNNVVFGDPSEVPSESGESESSDESDSSDETDSHIPVTYPNKAAGKIPEHAMMKKSFSSIEDISEMSSALTTARSQTATTLYLQMEYCRHENLRDIINSGIQSNTTECWRLFRQVVQGLGHIHSASIVHRDLKPENIFVDEKGDLRVGDFGLARPGELAILTPAHQKNQLGSFTRDIGTAWYIAPEVRSGGSGIYDQKADIFSLGIVFLEMLLSFSTGMERAETLKAISLPAHQLPTALTGPEYDLQGKMLMSLVEYDPKSRPDCVEISQNIPVGAEDQFYKQLRQELNDDGSKLRPDIISSLFAREPKDDNHFRSPTTFDLNQRVKFLEGAACYSPEALDLELQSMVKRLLSAVFHRHGAAERMDQPTIFPQHPYYASTDIVRFADRNGDIVQLPYDLVLPNALVLAKELRVEHKTFIFGDVFRPDPRKDEPRIFGEVAFDTTRSEGSYSTMDEAEMIKIIDEIIDAFPHVAKMQMCYHINHSRLLNQVLAHCEILPDKWAEVKQSLSKLNIGDWTWTRVRQELRSLSAGIPVTALEELGKFDFRDPIDKCIARIRSILSDTTMLEATFTQLTSLSKHIACLGVRRQVFLCPLSSYNENFYRDHVLFQCLYDRKRKTVFAAGGRYDHLVQDHQALTTRKSQIHAVGFHLTWSGLYHGFKSQIETQQKGKAKRKPNVDMQMWRSPRCEVLVDCYDSDLLDTRGLPLIADLWSNQFSAELAVGKHKSFGMANNSSKSSNYIWIVLIKSTELVKVRNMASQEEAEVRMTDLMHHLRTERRDRDRQHQKSKAAAGTLTRQESQPEREYVRENGGTGPEVTVLIPSGRSKKFVRAQMTEGAKAQAARWRQNVQNCPILAIEVKENTLKMIEKTRWDDIDGWKKLIQTVSGDEKHYLQELQTTLKVEMASASAAFLYNAISMSIIYYPLY